MPNLTPDDTTPMPDLQAYLDAATPADRSLFGKISDLAQHALSHLPPGDKDRAVASLTHLARENAIDPPAHVASSVATATKAAGEYLSVFGGAPGDPAAPGAYISTADATSKSLETSFGSLRELVKDTAQNLQQALDNTSTTTRDATRKLP